MEVERKKMEVRWERDAERIAKEMYDATLKGGLARWCEEFIEKAVSELCETDSGLSLSDAYEQVMQTDLGSGLYKTYCDMQRDDRQATKATLSKGEQADSSVGPVTREVFDKAERLVEKSARKLDRMEAVVKVLNTDPELYARYVKEVELSTAVG
ncbi:MAG: hypothetical protein O7B35_04790 [Deltaproteobacteria bacterium]|nr:hypothetical protein [Deltaproteobacteria bacterium]